ncbi:hypothetical protein O0L34_g11291 [Tuta absoluta]|nr:hypothetical protein O0L34_g11291 [Tuta absoluta]
MFNESYFADDFDLALWSQFVGHARLNEPQWLLVIFVVLLVFLFILSVTGNLITCVVIFFEKSMHTATNYYLLNLAFSDLIVTFGLWLEIDEYISEKYQFGRMGCKVHFILIILLWNNSILTMTALAIERYIGIMHPMSLKSKPVWRRVIKIIALIWLLAITATVPEYFNVYLVKTNKTTVCFLVPTRFSRLMNGVLALVMFIVPLVVMTSLYVVIAVRVSRTEQTTKRDQIFNHRDNSSKINRLIGNYNNILLVGI